MYTNLYDDLFDSDREIDTDFFEKRELDEFKIWKDVSGDHLNINLPEKRKEDRHE